MDGENGPEKFVTHRFVVRILRDNNGGLNKITLGIVTVSTSENLTIGRTLCTVKICLYTIERGTIKDSSEKALKISRASHFQCLRTCHELISESTVLPHLGRNEAHCGTALDPDNQRHLESSIHGTLYIGTLVNKMEILTTRLTRDSRIGSVRIDVLRNPFRFSERYPWILKATPPDPCEEEPSYSPPDRRKE